MTLRNSCIYIVFDDDDVNTVLLKIKCSERKVERAKYSELVTCPFLQRNVFNYNFIHISFRIKRELV